MRQATTTQTPAERTEDILWVPARALRFNRRNMYAIKPSAESHEMADSIKARGILQPLRIVPLDAHTYEVEDGNLRLQAVHELGDLDRPLPCRLSDAQGLDTGLNMAAVNLVRRAGDPVAEARHFKALMDEHGLSVQALARQIGIYPAKISGVMHLLDVDPEIQELVSARKLPRDARVHRALAAIPDRQARIGLAEKLAEAGANIKEIEAAAKTYLTVSAHERRLKTGRGRPRKDGAMKASDRLVTAAPPVLGPFPTLELSGDATPEPATALPLPDLRAAASAMCRACDLGTHAGQFAAEPSWALVVHAAEKTCTDCNLPKLREVCQACPGVALMTELKRGGRRG